MKLAILVVVSRGTSLHVNLIVVIFTGILVQTAELQGVVALDPRKAVGNIVDRAGGVGGIRPAAPARASRHIHGGDAIWNQFVLRENVGIVEADGGAVKEMRLIHRNEDLVEAEGEH